VVVGYVETTALDEVVCEETIFSLFCFEQFAAFEILAKKLGRPIRVHVKLDAMLGRLGFLDSDLARLAEMLIDSPWLKPEAAYTHFSTIKSNNLEFAQRQMQIFEEMVAELRSKTGWPWKTHMSASGGIVYAQERMQKDMLVRPGALLYGLWPAKKELQATEDFKLVQECLRFATNVIQVKKLPINYPIGYDRTYITHKETLLGIIPVGYSDGFDRRLSNNGEVLVDGIRCAVMGRISMNVAAIDLSNIPSVKVGDEVVIIGKQGAETIDLTEIATREQTIAYDVATQLNSNIPRNVIYA
jgi:alanine racemase